jgi:DNA polymerase I-like protein with 3'-5' exonuclease and polymerase domains
LGSPKDLTALFEKLKIKNPFVTGKGRMSFKANVMTRLKGQHPVIAKISQHAKIAKLESVYIGEEGLENYVDDNNRIHATAGTVGAVTGRGTSSNPNLMQIPSQADIYGIKECFSVMAMKNPEDWLMIVFDYAQLEIRVDTLYSSDPALTKILCDPKGDVHTNTSVESGVPRNPTAKQLNFLLLFGGGAYMLSENLSNLEIPTTVEEAQAYCDRYDAVYPGVREYRLRILREHQKEGFITYFTGRRRWIDDIDWSNRREVHKAETTLANNSVQGVGQDFLKASLIRTDYRCIDVDKWVLDKLTLPKTHKAIISDYQRKLIPIRKLLKGAETQFIQQVHDEAIWICKRKHAQEVANALGTVMTWRHPFPNNPKYKYTVPLVVEGGIGHSWKEAKSEKSALAHFKMGFDTFIED